MHELRWLVEQDIYDVLQPEAMVAETLSSIRKRPNHAFPPMIAECIDDVIRFRGAAGLAIALAWRRRRPSCLEIG